MCMESGKGEPTEVSFECVLGVCLSARSQGTWGRVCARVDHRMQGPGPPSRECIFCVAHCMSIF